MIMQGLDGQLGQGSHQDLIYATELHFSTILMSCCYGFVRSTSDEVEFTGPLLLHTAMLILVSMAVCGHKRSVNSTSINVNFLRFNEGLLHCLSCSSLSPSVFPFPRQTSLSPALSPSITPCGTHPLSVSVILHYITQSPLHLSNSPSYSMSSPLPPSLLYSLPPPFFIPPSFHAAPTQTYLPNIPSLHLSMQLPPKPTFPTYRPSIFPPLIPPFLCIFPSLPSSLLLPTLPSSLCPPLLHFICLSLRLCQPPLSTRTDT